MLHWHQSKDKDRRRRLREGVGERGRRSREVWHAKRTGVSSSMIMFLKNEDVSTYKYLFTQHNRYWFIFLSVIHMQWHHLHSTVVTLIGTVLSAHQRNCLCAAAAPCMHSAALSGLIAHKNIVLRNSSHYHNVLRQRFRLLYVLTLEALRLIVDCRRENYAAKTIRDFLSGNSRIWQSMWLLGN